MLGRHFIGIEREEEYREIAMRHLGNIRAYDKSALKTARANAPNRVPAGQLVERGMLRPDLTGPRGKATKVARDGTPCRRNLKVDPSGRRST